MPACSTGACRSVWRSVCRRWTRSNAARAAAPATAASSSSASTAALAAAALAAAALAVAALAASALLAAALLAALSASSSNSSGGSGAAKRGAPPHPPPTLLPPPPPRCPRHCPCSHRRRSVQSFWATFAQQRYSLPPPVLPRWHGGSNGGGRGGGSSFGWDCAPSTSKDFAQCRVARNTSKAGLS